MGVIQSGVLSGVSGKIAGVVGGRWKDKYYLRAWVKPANPNTAAQQTQRTKFSDVVAFCKPLVGQVFNAYTDKFIKAMSGFNFFIKGAIAEFDGTPVYANLLLTEGPLAPVATVSASWSGSVATITWAKALGNNGSDTDKVFAAVYRSNTGIWYFAAAEVDRSTETIDVPTSDGIVPGQMEVWVWPVKYVGTALNMIANSGHDSY